MQRGIAYAASAFFIWGIFPLYFKALASVPPFEILMHRMVWSLAFVLAILAWQGRWAWLAAVRGRPRVLAGFAASAVLLATNWFIYIWSVNHDRMIDSSLGYFINPLVNVLLGMIAFKERLRPVQWTAVGLAALGVAWLTWQAGTLPWIGLALAGTFGLYGLLRKKASLGALEGLALESMVLFPLAAGYLLWLTLEHRNTFAEASLGTQSLLMLAGPATAIPLLLFAAGARRIPMSLLGLLQYIGPSIQLVLAVWLYDEPMSMARLAGFVTIWTALAIYSMEGLWQSRAARPVDVVP